MSYTFKRWIYYDTIDKLSLHNVVFLLGPGRCGKTVCLKQLKKDQMHSNR